MYTTTQASTSVNFSTPSPPQQDCDPFLDPTLVKVIKTVAYSVLLILSLGGNSLVIAVIYRNRQLRTIVNFLILNMSVSDLLMPLFAHTRRIKQIYWPRGLWPVDGVFGSITCKFMVFAEYTSIAVSVFTLEIIAIERCFAIIFPMKKQPIRNKKTCFIAIASVWLIGAMWPSAHFYSFRLTQKGTTPYCINSWEPAFDHKEAFKIQFSIALVVFTILPFVLLTSLYSAISTSLHRQKANLHLAQEQIQRRAKKYRRITYMLVTVVLVFLMTWTPLNIYVFLSAFVWNSHRPCVSRHLIFSAVFVSYSYPAINPFIYYICNEDYRKGFQELLCCFKRCGSCCKNNSLAPAIEGDINFAVEPESSKAVVLVSMRPLNFESAQ